MTLTIIIFAAGLLAGAALALVAAVLWLRRTLARTRADLLQSAALDSRALGARIAALESRPRAGPEA